MITHLRRNPIAFLALFFALGTGAAYAGGHLGRNSVGTRQLKNNSVTSSKVRNHSLRAADFAAGQLPAGPRGETGAKGDLGPAGPRGEPGEPGEPGRSALSPLPPGQSESGDYAVWAESATAGEKLVQSFTFPVRLEAALAADHVVYVPYTESSTPVPHCPGRGSAEAGYMCIYSGKSLGIGGAPAVSNFEQSGGAYGTGRLGFNLQWEASAATVFDSGVYTVTAP